MTTQTTEEPRAYSVRDQLRTLEFDGTLLARATTESPHSPRWTEIEIYKTVGGNYVVHRVGVSLVYHDADASCATGDEMTVGELGEDAEPCKFCDPGRFTTPTVLVAVEADRHSADSASTPRQVGDALLIHPHGRSPYLSGPAQDVLSRAIKVDPSLRDAFQSERIT